MSDILSLHESDSPSTRQCQEGGSAVGEIIMRLAEVKNRESILLTSWEREMGLLRRMVAKCVA